MGDDSMSKNVVLQINRLNKNYSSKNVIEDLSLSIEKDEFLCILGASGCGKTTLLRCIAGFEEYCGEIIVDGKKCDEPGLDRIMVFQDFNQLFPWKTVEKNIQYP